MIRQPLLQAPKVLIPGWTSFRELLGRSLAFCSLHQVTYEVRTYWRHVQTRQVSYMIGPNNLRRERGKKAERLCPNFIPTLLHFSNRNTSSLKRTITIPFKSVMQFQKARVVLQPISSTIKLLQGDWFFLGQLPIQMPCSKRTRFVTTYAPIKLQADQGLLRMASGY